MNNIEFKVSDYIDWNFIRLLEKVKYPTDFIAKCEDHIEAVLTDLIGVNDLFHFIPTDEEKEEFYEDIAFILSKKGMKLHEEYMTLFHNIAEYKFPNDMDWIEIKDGLID